ncbi:MAG: acyl-ACP--UDP-N-acetylglucosamine O-acyltransferase, partial [cyanobacterium endosymbiont of Rhopalodia inflata]
MISDNEYFKYLHNFLMDSTTGEKRRGPIPAKA